MKCQALFDIIDSMQAQYLDFLEDVCNIESPTDYKEGVDAVGSYFLEKARKNGWKTEIFAQKTAGNVICITLNPEADLPAVSVSAHMDTVYPLGTFGTPAVRRDDNNMYGPGVMDCKGGAVAAFMAMDALSQCGFHARPVQLLLQSDEETGSATSQKSTITYICEKAKDSAAFLNLEGLSGSKAVLRRKGILRYRFTVCGKALHSSRCADGSNAIAEAAYKIIELEKMKDPNGLTCNCGVIEGGTKANTVAAFCTFTADIRYSTLEEEERAKQIVQNVADTVTVKGCTCEVQKVSDRPAMIFSEKNAALLERMNAIFMENGLPYLTPGAALGGSDAAYVTMYGIPCVDNLGPEGANIHSTDEYIRLDSLAESAKRIASVIYCY